MFGEVIIVGFKKLMYEKNTAGFLKETLIKKVDFKTSPE